MQRGCDKSVTEVTVSSLLLRLFHRNRSGEQDVVFKGECADADPSRIQHKGWEIAAEDKQITWVMLITASYLPIC